MVSASLYHMAHFAAYSVTEVNFLTIAFYWTSSSSQILGVILRGFTITHRVEQFGCCETKLSACSTRFVNWNILLFRLSKVLQFSGVTLEKTNKQTKQNKFPTVYLVTVLLSSHCFPTWNSETITRWTVRLEFLSHLVLPPSPPLPHDKFTGAIFLYNSCVSDFSYCPNIGTDYQPALAKRSDTFSTHVHNPVHRSTRGQYGQFVYCRFTSGQRGLSGSD